MNTATTPRSLRSSIVAFVLEENGDIDASLKITAACLMAAGSITSADAQDAPLPPVTIDAPVARPRPPAAKPTAEQLKVRAALRRQAQQAKQAAQAAPARAPNAAGAQAPDRDPYADPGAPYK